jgi:hypothetical protein
MEWLTIEIQDGANAFLPGETLAGTASWQLDSPAATAELRLFWYTQGKGDQDVGVVTVVPFASPGLQDRRTFRVRLPEGPYSFSGKLVSLAWALELVVEPGSRASRTEITVSPMRQEILIGSVATQEK